MFGRFLLAILLSLHSVFAVAGETSRSVEVGLYQSAPEPIPRDIKPTPEMEGKAFRTFLRVFPEKRCALIMSFSHANDLWEKLIIGSKFTDNGTPFEEFENGIVFNHGPTKHTVSIINVETISLQSRYANGYVRERRLYRVKKSE